MARKKNIDKLHEAIGGEKDWFGDMSASWVRIENDKFSIDFVFDAKGEKLEDVKIAQKIWQVVDEKVIITINSKDIKS